MSEIENTTAVNEEKTLENEANNSSKKKPFKKKKLIIGLSILAGISIIIAVAVPITLNKLFPSMNMSFLKNYQAQIEDAESLGISLVNKKPSFVKGRTVDHDIVDVPFVKKDKKKSSNKRSTIKNDTAELFKNADGVLNRYLVYEDYTFVEFVAKKSEMIQEETKAPYYYYPAYYRPFNAYDSWIGQQLMVQYREDQYINNYSIDENGVAFFDKNAYFTWNKTHQSFVVDNRTGYIYPLDFLKIGESINVVNGALSLNIPRSDDYWMVDHHLMEFSIENDNLVISNVIKNEGLRYGIICKDKYGQYFVVAEIANDQIDYENKIYAFNKDYGTFYEYGTGGDYNQDIIKLNLRDNELALFTGSDLNVFGDNFSKNSYDEYTITKSNGLTTYKKLDTGEFVYESYSIHYPNESYSANEFYYYNSETDVKFTVKFYSAKFITDFENDEIVLIGGLAKNDGPRVVAAFTIKIGTLIEELKAGHEDSDTLLNNGTVIFEGIDSYSYTKENYHINYCVLEVAVSSFDGTQVYVLTLDENGNYIFVEKESYVAKDITITISPINKD